MLNLATGSYHGIHLDRAGTSVKVGHGYEPHMMSPEVLGGGSKGVIACRSFPARWVPTRL
jgi:hypothetical protein